MTQTSQNESVRHCLRAALRGGWYPVLLPHVKVVTGGLSILGADPTPVSPEMAKALALCNGTRKLSDIASASGATREQIVEDRSRVILWPIPLRQGPVRGDDKIRRSIILSPHLDDAPLSLGSQMQMRFGIPDLVVNVFSTVSWWRFEIKDGDLPRIQLARNAEDDLAMRLMGCEVRYWGYGEAPLRGYPLKEIFTTARLPEADVVHDEIRRRVSSLAAEFITDTWWLPLAVGNHVDHRILRDAAIDGLRDANVPAAKIRFYEDLPYTAKVGGVPDFTTFLEESWPGARLEIAGFSPSFTHRHKLTMLRAYYTQLADGHYGLIDDYARRMAGWRRRERYWRLAANELPNNGTRKP